MVTEYEITRYYLLVIGIRERIFYWKLPLYLFLSVAVGFIILDIAGAEICGKKRYELLWSEVSR